jgi:hypothetical protein
MRPAKFVRMVIAAGLVLGCITFSPRASAAGSWRKDRDVILYKNPDFYSAFPSIVRREDGELIAAFRRAPERRQFGEKSVTHTDPNSYLVLIRSKDQGQTWTTEPEMIYAHPFGGSQDPCLIQLRDQSILCASYGWALMQPDSMAAKRASMKHGGFVFMGGYLLRSLDGGKHWEAPLVPPPIPGETNVNAFGKPVPAFNRGALCQGKDGRLFWAVAAAVPGAPNRTAVHLMISSNGGIDWSYSCPIATDAKVTFNETSLYETAAGDLVAFIRTADFDDHTVLARSKDGGKTFAPWEDAGFQGHPHYALRLPGNDGVLLVYGYRHKPFGIRARILNADCTSPSAAQELVLRDDGGNGDLGYPWAVQITEKKVLVVYYFNQSDGTRHIAGTLLTRD